MGIRDGQQVTTPAADLLVALAEQRLDRVTELLAADAVLVVPQTGGRYAGQDAVVDALREVSSSFADVAYHPQKRYVQSDQVVEVSLITGTHVGTFAGTEPTGRRVELPVRLSVGHDQTHVQKLEVQADLPLLWKAMGREVSWHELAASQVGALRFAADRELATYVDEPKPERETAPKPANRKKPPKRSKRRAVMAVAAALVAAAGAAGLFVMLGSGRDPVPTAAAKPATSPPADKPSRPDDREPKKPRPDPKPEPKADKNTVTLSSDVTFAFGSAALSKPATRLLHRLAADIRREKLRGQILVRGYTDNIGSASSSLTLSRQRADAVADVLRRRLEGVPVTIRSRGLGDSHPVGNNATAAGRALNRRVTIELPHS